MKPILLSLTLLPVALTGCVHVGAGVDVDVYNSPPTPPPVVAQVNHSSGSDAQAAVKVASINPGPKLAQE